MGSTPIRMREIILLLMCGGIALFMLDLANLGVLLGWIGVLVWAYCTVVGPRQSLAIAFVVGAAGFVMTIWWPDEGWIRLAIPLLWVSIAIMLGSILMWVMRRVTR